MFYNICKSFEMNWGGVGIGKEDGWALNCFYSHIPVLVKTRFVKQAQLFFIPHSIGLQPE